MLSQGPSTDKHVSRKAKKAVSAVVNERTNRHARFKHTLPTGEKGNYEENAITKHKSRTVYELITVKKKRKTDPKNNVTHL